MQNENINKVNREEDKKKKLQIRYHLIASMNLLDPEWNGKAFRAGSSSYLWSKYYQVPSTKCPSFRMRSRMQPGESEQSNPLTPRQAREERRMRMRMSARLDEMRWPQPGEQHKVRDLTVLLMTHVRLYRKFMRGRWKWLGLVTWWLNAERIDRLLMCLYWVLVYSLLSSKSGEFTPCAKLGIGQPASLSATDVRDSWYWYDAAWYIVPFQPNLEYIRKECGHFLAFSLFSNLSSIKYAGCLFHFNFNTQNISYSYVNWWLHHQLLLFRNTAWGPLLQGKR